ncbi:MAG: glycosyltransferase [Bacteroidia bacterium]|nr:glycosyltransferase [Bacteroidia bacterium]
MPRILRIINRFNLGGITFNVSNLSKDLSPEFETMLIGGKHLPHEESSLFIPESMGLSPVILPEMSREIDPVNDWKAVNRIRSIIRDFQPDIVHTHAAKAGALGRHAARKEKVPVIVHTFHGHVFHSYFGKLKTGIYKNIERTLAKHTDAIIALSEEQKRELSEEHRICLPEKIHVIPLGFDLDRFLNVASTEGALFRSAYNIPADRTVISIVGRLVPVKNHRLFIRSIQQLCIRYPRRITAVIAGDGSEREALETEKKICGLRDDELIFTSWIRETEKLYAASDIVALTSHNEGTPVSLIEALASGKAVVSTRVGGVQEVVNESCGILTADNNLQELTTALDRLVIHTLERENLGIAGREKVKDKFSHIRLASDTSELYRKLLNTSR